MAEKEFFNQNGILVTNTRFVIPGQTFAMSGVTAVESLKETPSRKGPVIMIVLGLLAMVAGDAGIAIGFLLIAGGVAWIVLNKPKFWVVLHTASGQSKAFNSTDESLINKIISALNEAIIERG